MAWSPQARAAAIAARKARARGSSKKLAVTRHPMIKMNGHHGVSGVKRQPVSMHGHKGQQIKRYAKTAAIGAGVAAVAYGAYKNAELQNAANRPTSFQSRNAINSKSRVLKHRSLNRQQNRQTKKVIKYTVKVQKHQIKANAINHKYNMSRNGRH